MLTCTGFLYLRAVSRLRDKVFVVRNAGSIRRILRILVNLPPENNNISSIPK